MSKQAKSKQAKSKQAKSKLGKSKLAKSKLAKSKRAKSKLANGKFALRVGRSRSGKGVFASEEIPRGARIIEYIGRSVSEEETKHDNGKYFFWASKTKMIDGNIRANRARYINHSCRPNCRAEGPNGRIFIVARRRIKAGEELTYDYGREYFDKHIKPKGCRCVKCAA
jgi:SET domain-containing protein